MSVLRLTDCHYYPSIPVTPQFPNITDIVFPTAWVDEWPYLVATEVQAGWAVSNKVNFLASGYHNPASYGTAEISSDIFSPIVL